MEEHYQQEHEHVVAPPALPEEVDLPDPEIMLPVEPLPEPIKEDEDLPVAVEVVPAPIEETKTEITKEAQSPNCCDKFLKCLSHVPCASLIAWIILLLGIGGLTGSLLIGANKTRDLLHNQSLLWFMDYTIIGVIVSMFVLGTIFLIIGHISSEPTSRRVFSSSSKNRCARGLNMGFLSFVYILTLCWIFATAVLFVPLVFLGLLYYITDYEGLTSIDLKYYGFAARELSGEALTTFVTEAKDVLICYGCAYISSVLVAISLIHFLISMTANITHLTDNRFAALNAYEPPGEEMRNSKHSNLDTNM